MREKRLGAALCHVQSARGALGGGASWLTGASVFNKGSAGLPVMGSPSKEESTRQWKHLAAAWEGGTRGWTNASEFRLVILWVPFTHH